MSGFLSTMLGVSPIAAAGRTALTMTAVNQAQIDTAQSKFGGASALFDGTDDSITSAPYSSLALNSGNFTIEGWIYTSDTLSEFLNFQDYNTNNGWAIGTRSSNRFLIVNSNGSTSLNVLLTSNNAFTSNTWTHFAFVYQASTTTMTIYANGTNVGSNSSWSSPDLASVDGLRIGTGYGNSGGLFNDGPYYFSGWLDEIRISNTARYTANFTAPTTPFVNDTNTVLLLHMNGADGSTTFTDDNTSTSTTLFSVKKTLTGIDMAAPDSKPYQTVFMGDDSSQNPVFAYGYRDASDFIIKVVAFKVSKTDGTLTIGTPSNVMTADGDNNLYSVISLVSENMDAATRTTSYSNFGYIGFYHGNSTNLSRIFAFSVDTSTLAVTVGSGLSHSSSVDSGVTSLMYVGNSRVVFGMRGGSSYRYYNMFSRSGTTLTSQASGTLTANAAGGNFKGSAAVNFSGSSYRFATISDNVGLDVGQFVNTTLYSDSETKASVLSNSDLASNAGWVIPLNTTDKFLLAGYNSTNTTLYAQAVSVNWGSTTPTNTLGTTITLTGNDVSPLAFAPGRSNDEAYYIYESGSTIRYRIITASGTTLTQGGEINTGISSTNLSKVQRYDVAKSGSGDYLVGVVDDPSNTDNQVVIFKLDYF